MMIFDYGPNHDSCNEKHSCGLILLFKRHPTFKLKISLGNPLFEKCLDVPTCVLGMAG